MEILRIIVSIVSIVFILICIALTVIILSQEGKNNALGSLTGSSNVTYWDKNKGRSIEGNVKKVTRILLILFIIVAIILNCTPLA